MRHHVSLALDERIWEGLGSMIEAACAEHKGGGLISCPSDGNLLLNGAPPSCFARPNIPRMNIEGEGWSIICLLDSKQ